ncbi:MAG TPA: hypothetical protein VKY74_09445 [Chloroflexia bacterium]|nr:hypothetical protein [Chloroflexia bacterium]
MRALAVRSLNSVAALSLGLALSVGLLTACDLGGAPAPAGTPVPGSITGTTTISGTVGSGPTDTPRPPTDTPVPTLTPVQAVGKRTGNPTTGYSWRLVGLTGQQLFAVGGPVQPDAAVYVAGTGVYRSSDQGQTWNQLGFDNRTQAEEIVVSRSNPQVLYAGSGDNCAGGPKGAQFRSSDGGTTWTPLPAAPRSLQVAAKDENQLTAIRCDGVVRSSDGGQTWTPLLDAALPRGKNFNGQKVVVPAGDPNMIYALYVGDGGSSRLRVSSDGGQTWGGDETEYPGISDLMVDDKRTGRAWAAGQNGILRTIDGGQNWLLSVTGLDAAHETSASGSQGAYQLSALKAQYNASGDLIELYAASYGTEKLPGAGIFTSKDGGEVWTRLGGDLGGLSISSLHVTIEKGDVNDTVVMYAATEDGLQKIALNSAR